MHSSVEEEERERRTGKKVVVYVDGRRCIGNNSSFFPHLINIGYDRWIVAEIGGGRNKNRKWMALLLLTRTIKAARGSNLRRERVSLEIFACLHVRSYYY